MRAWPVVLQAIIFDHDNTIADTESLWVQAADRILEDRGIVLSEHEYDELARDMLGLGAALTTRMLINRYQLPDKPSDLYDEKCRIVRQLYHSHLSFIKGFQKFAEKIVQKGLKRAIVSNSDSDSLAISAEKLHLYEIFGDHMYNVSHVRHPKPAPDLYLYALKQLNVRPEDAIAIEDSARGIAAAQAAGIFCVGLNSSHDHSIIEKADLCIDRYDELNLVFHS